MTRIVVGVDATAAGIRALEWALREALSQGASVTAVRAWTAPTFKIFYPVDSALANVDAEVGRNAQQLAEDQLKLAVEQVPGAEAVEAQAVAVPGPPAQVLVDQSQDASLLVVGSRGAGVLSRAVLGSVASSVLHHATVPVVVVPEVARAEGTDGVAGRVIVGVDHSRSSQQALSFAVDAARRTGRTLVPVFVHEPVMTIEAGVDLSSLEVSEQRSLVHAVHAAGATDIAVEPEVLTGQASAALNLLAHPHDLLVVGSRGRGGFVGLLLGSTSTQVAQHATCPVAVVRSA